VTEVFATASALEGVGSGVINGFEGGDFSGAFLDTANELLTSAAGIGGAAGQLAAQVNSRIIKAANFNNPCAG